MVYGLEVWVWFLKSTSVWLHYFFFHNVMFEICVRFFMFMILHSSLGTQCHKVNYCSVLKMFPLLILTESTVA